MGFCFYTAMCNLAKEGFSQKRPHSCFQHPFMTSQCNYLSDQARGDRNGPLCTPCSAPT